MAGKAGQGKTSRLPQKESPEAALAFADYVEMTLNGEGSIRALHERYRVQTEPKPPTKRLATLAGWSSAFGWKDRVKSALNEQAEEKLEEAATLDADTSLMLARETNRRAKWADALRIDELLKMRESVRKPAPKGGANVNVSVSVEVKHMAERMAKAMGIDAEQLIADAELIAAEEWDKS